MGGITGGATGALGYGVNSLVKGVTKTQPGHITEMAIKDLSPSADDVATPLLEDKRSGQLLLEDKRSGQLALPDKSGNKTYVNNPFDDAGLLKANVEYQAGEFNYNYKTDSNGRITNWNTDNLQLTQREPRLPYNSKTPGKVRAEIFGVETSILYHFFCNCNDSCLHDTVFVYLWGTVCIFLQIENLPFFQHGFFTACYNAARLCIQSFYNKINLRAEHIVENLILA